MDNFENVFMTRIMFVLFGLQKLKCDSSWNIKSHSIRKIHKKVLVNTESFRTLVIKSLTKFIKKAYNESYRSNSSSQNDLQTFSDKRINRDMNTQPS